MQTFLSAPKFNNKYIYPNPVNTYQQFVNTYAFNKMATTGTPSPNRNVLCKEVTKEWLLMRKKEKNEIDTRIKEYLNTQVQLRGCITIPTTLPRL